jgi:hypothetical protein
MRQVNAARERAFAQHSLFRASGNPDSQKVRRVPIIIAAAILPLIVGAASAVLVAWALATHDSLKSSEQSPAAWPAGEHGAIVRFMRTNVGLTHRSYRYISSAFVDPGAIKLRFPRSTSTTKIPRAAGEPPTEVTFVPDSNVVGISTYGFPFRCLYSVEWRKDTGGSFPSSHVASHGLLHNRRWSDPLPSLPAWPGLLANTAIYAAPWYALFLIPTLRRARRRRRGLCPRCAYDLKGLTSSAPCPECGQRQLRP